MYGQWLFGGSWYFNSKDGELLTFSNHFKLIYNIPESQDVTRWWFYIFISFQCFGNTECAVTFTLIKLIVMELIRKQCWESLEEKGSRYKLKYEFEQVTVVWTSVRRLKDCADLSEHINHAISNRKLLFKKCGQSSTATTLVTLDSHITCLCMR